MQHFCVVEIEWTMNELVDVRTWSEYSMADTLPCQVSSDLMHVVCKPCLYAAVYPLSYRKLWISWAVQQNMLQFSERAVVARTHAHGRKV